MLIVKLAVSAAGLGSFDVPAFRFDLSLTEASLLGLSAVVVILLLETGASHLLARAAARASPPSGCRALHAYLAPRWEVQAVDAEGHLQELLTTQSSRVANALTIFASGLVNAASFLVMAIAAFIVDFHAALLAVGAVVVLLGLSRPLTRAARRQAAVQTGANLEFTEAVAESVAHAREIRLFDVGSRVEQALTPVIERSSAAYYWSRFLLRVAPVLFRAGAAVIAIGTILLVAKTATGSLASVGAAVLILLRALGYAQGVQNTYQQIGEALPWLESLQRKLHLYESNRDPEGIERLAEFEEIAFDDVTFRYPRGDAPALRSVSFRLRRGEVVGVIGPSGSGKTSLVQLLLQMYEPTEGEIRVDGVPLSEISRRDWRSRVAFVPQESRVSARHDLRRDPLLPPRAPPGGRRARRDVGARPRLRCAAAARLRRRDRPPERGLLGRSAAAAEHRQGASRRPPAPDPRRADERARPRVRGRHPGDSRSLRGR